MGVSFTALAVSKIFDLLLYQMFYGEAAENQYQVGRPEMIFGYARWLFMLVVTTPLLYANLRVWVSEWERARLAVVGVYATLFAVLIIYAQRFIDLNALVPYILLPVAVLTIVTFLFTYAQKRLPNVHGLLVGIGWLAYLVTSSLRPALISNGTETINFVTIAEMLDILAWLVLFAGFAVKPRFVRVISLNHLMV